MRGARNFPTSPINVSFPLDKLDDVLRYRYGVRRGIIRDGHSSVFLGLNAIIWKTKAEFAYW